MRLDPARGQAGLMRIADDWNRLCDSMESPRFFHRPEWYSCYLGALEEEPDSLVFCALYDGDSLQAVIPWKQSRRKISGLSLQTLELPKYDVPLHDFAARSRERAPQLFRQALTLMAAEPSLSWDQIRMTHLLEDSYAWAAIGDLPQALRAPVGHCDEIACLPYDELLDNLSKNFKGNLRKARNKLGRVEQVEWVQADSAQSIREAYSAFLTVEASGWKADGEAVRLSPRKTAFYRTLLEHYARKGRAEIALLRAEGRPLAAQLSIIEGETLYLLRIGYDESQRRLAPGNLLLEHLLQRLGEQQQIRTVNLISGAPWHLDWKARRQRTYHGFLAGPTWKGRMVHAAMRARRRLKKKQEESRADALAGR